MSSAPGIHFAIFIYGPTGGGATRRTFTLAEGFTARGHRVDLVVINPTGPLADALPPGVEMVQLDSPLLRLTGRLHSRRRQIAASAFALARYLRHRQPQLLLSAANHVHMSAAWARRLAGGKIPLVLRVSNHLTQSHLYGGSKRPRPLRLRLARRLYGWADTAIAVSAAIAEDVAHHTSLPASRIHTIINPTFTPELLAKAKAPLHHPWLEPGSPPLILCAGRLAPGKDFPTLLHAFATLREQRPARLVILGEGKRRGELEALARELGIDRDLALPGFVDNPMAWMARASVFALSSSWEGSPGVLIEAMACGCPVVSTNCPSGPDEILDGGRFGPLVPVGDPTALAKAILDTLDAPRDPEKLRQRASEFSVERAIDRYLEVLLAVAESSPRRG